MVWDGGKWLEVYLGCSYNDFITICFIIGGNYYWKHTIKEGIYKACKDGAAAFVHGVSDAFTLSICFEALERFSAFLNRKNLFTITTELFECKHKTVVIDIEEMHIICNVQIEETYIM